MVMRRHPSFYQAISLFTSHAPAWAALALVLILDRATNGEVIERLKPRAVESKYLVNRVIKKAADSRRTDACRLRFQI